jgi:hypothetical protein
VIGRIEFGKSGLALNMYVLLILIVLVERKESQDLLKKNQ